MADNLALMQGSDTLIASDDVDGVQVLRIKVQTGEDGIATDVSETSPLPVAVQAAGLSVFRAVGLGNAGRLVKDTPGRVFGWHLANAGTAGAFVKLYDLNRAATVGTDAPATTLFVPAGAAISLEHPNGIAFTAGISVAATAGGAADDTSAAAAGTVIVNLFYADAAAADAAAGGGQGVAPVGEVAPTANMLAKRDASGKLYGAGYDAGDERITHVADPTQPTDAASKAYVDAQRPVMVAAAASVASTTFTVIGRAELDPSIFPAGATFRLQAIIEATPGQTAEVRLYNVTDGAAVAGSTLSTSSATPTVVSTPVTLPAAARMYEVQLRLTSALTLFARATCTRAEITT